MSSRKKIKKYLFETLKELSRMTDKSFSGIGVLLYETDVFSEKYFVDLRPSFSCPENIVLGKKRTTKTLLEIADKSNPLHDGFIFFNEEGKMMHVSQYFAPLPRGNIVPNESYGARYRTAQYGSLLEGVILTGVINHDNRVFVFYKGRSIGLDEELK